MARIRTRLNGGAAGSRAFMDMLYPKPTQLGPRASTEDPLSNAARLRRAIQQGQYSGPYLPSADTLVPKGATPPKKPMNLMERLSPEFGTPASAGLGAAAATGLQMSGYSPTPISTAQGLGAMMQSGMQAFQAAKAAETAEKRAKMQDEIAMLTIKQKMGKPSDLVKLFDEKTGREYNARYQPDHPQADDFGYVRVGGVKTGTRNLETIFTEGGGSYKGIYDPTNPQANADGYVQVGGVKPPSGMSMTVNPDTGEVTYSTGVGVGGMEKTTKKGLETDITNLTNRVTQLDQIAKDFNPDFLKVPTQMEFAARSLGEKYNILDIPQELKGKMLDYSNFRGRTQEIFSTILKELSGAAVTKFELANARAFLPDKGDAPTVFQAKLRGFTATSNAILYRAQNLLSGEDKLTDNLAKKYPLSISKATDEGTKTMYINEYVDAAMMMNKNLTQSQALAKYAEEALNVQQ